MLLDRIDIDTHGPLTRVELGPFSESLNVICAPEGSGKTAIVRFIRDSLIRRDYPLGMMSSSAGRVVWADRNGKIHCRREHDGTPSGRRTIEFESRGEAAHRFDWLHGSWINGIADSTDATRALESIRIPESIVDGIVTDTAVISVSRVIGACLRSGLGDPALFAGLPVNRSIVSGLSPAESADQHTPRRAMRDELARIEAELASIRQTSTGPADTFDEGSGYLYPSLSDTQSIAARRRQLQARLAALHRAQQSAQASPQRRDHGAAFGAELAELHDQIWQLRVRHSELSRWLAHLQFDRNRVRYTAPITASPYARDAHADLAGGLAIGHGAALDVDAELRRKLIDVDAQITRWRRVMTELSGLREIISSDVHRDAVGRPLGDATALPMSEHMLRRERMHHFLSSLDRYAGDPSAAASWSAFAAGARPTRWPDEIDLRIEAIVRQVDWLAARYDQPHSAAPVWYRDLPEDLAYRGSRSLVHSLHAIRDDLQNVRRHGFRFAHSATEPSREARAAEHALAVRRDHELYDLRRSEQWVVATIERLLAYREGLVRNRQLAERLRYPSWMDEAYHRQTWSAWYINHLDGEAIARGKELDQVTAQLDRCVARAAQLRRQMLAQPMHPVAAPPSAYAGLGDPGLGYLGLGDLGPSGFAVDPSMLQMEIDAVESELRALDSLPQPDWADTPRMKWLKRRRAELIQRLGVPQAASRSASPLADEASQWLVRLSGGRLSRLDWSDADFTTAPGQVEAATRVGFAKIDGREEANCPAADRALAALALRMAAADLLARTGRAIPLVIEVPRELVRLQDVGDAFGAISASDAAFPIQTGGSPAVGVNLSVLAALDDFAKNGRQVVMLASDSMFADQVARHGGQVFTIHGQRVQHEHRPLWSPHFSDEGYAGPHAASHLPPSSNGLGADGVVPHDPMPHSDAFVDRYHDEYFDHLPIGASLADINRNLDAVWQEAYGISPYAESLSGRHNAHVAPHSPSPRSPYAESPYAESPYAESPYLGAGYMGPASSAAPVAPATQTQTYRASMPAGSPGPMFVDPAQHDSGHWHDGYYFADSYTTAPAAPSMPATQSIHGSPAAASRSASGHLQAKTADARSTTPQGPVSPFFLSVDSPIDQAPSIDAVAAARLRRLQVTHINHLMNQDPNRLADSLGLAGVTAATIRRWQAESRLVCHVPQLRGFDARVLVGCGIADAGHLASIDPADLLDRVEAFLATERGQRILLSGTSYELSRITSWIAAANVDTDDNPLGMMRDHQTVDGRVLRQPHDRKSLDAKLDDDRYEYEFVDDSGNVVRASSNRSRSTRRSSGTRQRSGGLSERSNGSRNGSRSINGAARSRDTGSDGRRRRASRSGSGRQADAPETTDQGYRTSGDETDRSDRTRSRRGGDARSRRSASRSASRSSRRGAERSSSEHASSSERASSSDRSPRRERMRDETRSFDSANDDKELRFYLQRESPIVDAPSIGSRMAEKLEAVGIFTVDDLLNADPTEVADQLNHRRIDAEVITAWQNQAILVCRVPMLRGHDAQLLVAADVTTAEEVAEYDPSELFALIDPVARSNEGKRIIRGGQLPDLDEITEWIQYAALSRELVAA
ncbi:ATP-dependent DNA helicase RecG [Stieleria neptunia]|uniref:ATP-dependent DNA helicase RecG n=1 Tax=Stieleria neptunia TaxID=2527979 RepID=A0A518HZ00_9BACT|nr:DUF4332 domain-containing protein [Stieleria neptunia]QDV46017.1 ATP-dependent DNA helicase RecG [Stieleria neptunia]